MQVFGGNRVRCENGHPCILGANTCKYMGNTASCNKCYSSLATQVAWSCSTCQYDLCASCYSGGGVDVEDDSCSSSTMTMYHGTSRENAEKIERSGFHPSADGMLGRGVYVSRQRAKAAAYVKGNDGVILELSVRCGRVKKIDHQGHPLQKRWHEHGFDSAWVPQNSFSLAPSGLEEDCIWDPSRIEVIGRVKG